MRELPAPVHRVRTRVRRVSCSGELFADVTLDFGPGDGFENEVPADLLPAPWAERLAEGVREGLDGVRARVTLRSAHHRPYAHPERSLGTAGYQAAREALARAGLIGPGEPRTSGGD
ncbi:hypothetical protein ACIBCM_26200 [Streptomyces sp. NPDC051018]|uniref:hypothetical protein n=1 Tax=Streptomyces sp. NPDC051018 TaxID=3365639 RepID=UPI00378C4840